ncbi:NADH-quinone oxidoreductase subunit N, partial [Promicromonospora sp. NPDC060204]
VMVFQPAPITPGVEPAEGEVLPGAAGAGETGGGAGGGVATATKVQVTAAQRVVVTVVRSRGPAAVAIAVCALATVILGIFPSLVLNLAAEASKFVP